MAKYVLKNLFYFLSKKEYTLLVKIYTNSIPFLSRPCLDYPILHKRSHLFILQFHMSLAILSYTSPTFTIPHAISFMPLVQLMGEGNNHLGTSYFHCISIPFVAAIGVVHHRFQKSGLINYAPSSVPAIRSY